MGQILFTDRNKPSICHKEENLLKHAWNALKAKSVNRTIIYDLRKLPKWIPPPFGPKQCWEYTPLVIACMYRDLKLAKKLIKKGADVNLIPLEHKYTRGKDVPPLYYATSVRDADIVKLLLKSGANVNRNIGRAQSVNFLGGPYRDQESVIDINRTCSWTESCKRPEASLLTLVEIYLAAGAKLNSTLWGPCLFLGRGKKFRATRPNRTSLPNPYFKCDLAILLLQHGVDPNLYKLEHVWPQFSEHNRCNGEDNCVSVDVLLQTFLAAGYYITDDDRNNQFIKETLRDYNVNVDGPMTLKHQCRSQIRTRLREVSGDTTIFPFIEELPIPILLKKLLKLNDIINLNDTSFNCTSPFRSFYWF